jgi:non-specific serine/threonine protein kinase
LLANSLARHRVLGQPGGIALCLEGFAQIAIKIDRSATAARLLGAADTLRASNNAARQPADRDDCERLRMQIASAIGMDGLNQATRDGEMLPIEGAIAETHDLARQVSGGLACIDSTPTHLPPPRMTSEPLTAREQEVATLVARGLTNRQIAEMLVVSRRTVDAHVASILSRLGFTTRAQIAVWAAERSRAPSGTTEPR